jgi:hypothetical protein
VPQQDHNAPVPLIERFKRLMLQHLRAESIDALITPENDVEGLQRADYLLAGRSVIVEQKALETDPNEKIEAEVDRLSSRDDWPLFFGKVELSTITRQLPDGDEIMMRVFTKISRSVENAFKSADKQIRDTRQLLKMPPSTPGMLVLLNERIETIGPDVIKHRIGQLLHARNQDGSRRYPNVGLVMLFTEAHVLLDEDKKGGRAPVMTFEGPSATPKLMETAHNIVRAWAAAHGWNVEQEDPAVLEAIERRSNWEKALAPQMKRHEVWRLKYRSDRYLRELTDENLLAHGRRLIVVMTPHYLIGGVKLAPEALMKLTEGWTHFLEEAAIRGLDLKRLGPMPMQSEVKRD